MIAAGQSANSDGTVVVNPLLHHAGPWLNRIVPEIFAERDLSDAVFWGVHLQRSLFRDADFSGSTFFHVLLSDVSIDGEIDRLVVNGVDVTDYVNQHDRWYPLRNQLSPDSVDGIRRAWDALGSEWAVLLERVSAAEPAVVDQSVNDEWSLTQTLRHLIFAMDKWFMLPILGARAFHPLGLTNTSSSEREWPGIDPQATPDFSTVLDARVEQHRQFTAFISSMRLELLPATVSVLENGTVPALQCFHVVLEEEFEHLRYMIRDLTTLGLC